MEARVVVSGLVGWTPAARHRRRRDAALVRALPSIARAIARATSAGLPLPDAVERAAEAVDPAVTPTLRDIAIDLRGGVLPEAAFAPLANLPGGRLLVGAIGLHGEVGGDLVRSLAAIADGLAERERLQAELAAATAQARVAARAVPLAPLASLLLLGVMAPEALVELVTTGVGLGILTVAGVAIVTAHLLVRRIAREALA